MLTWAAAWGALALLKRHFGLAIEVGRQGQGQARQRRKSLVDKWLSPPHTRPPSCWSPVEKLHHCSFSSKSRRQDKQPNAQTGLRLTCFHKETETADAQEGNLLRQVQQWAPRGLHVPTALSPSGEGVRGLRQEPWAASIAGVACSPGSKHLSHSWISVK